MTESDSGYNALDSGKSCIRAASHYPGSSERVAANTAQGGAGGC